MIVVSGSNLAGGDDYRCDIGGNELIPARYDPSNGTVVCSPTPATLSLSASAPFTIRLNAQERVSSSSTGRIFAPPQIDSITPSSGTFLGNTTVTFRGTNFVDSAAAGELRCRFGTQEVPGTFESSSSAVCVSPPADYAGAMASYDWMAAGDEVVGTEGYIPDPPETRVTAYGLTLLGAAVLKPVAYGEDYGYVRLVQSAYSGPGAIILPPIPQPYAGASPYFDASFDIRLWGSASHHGLSFCYGDLPAQAWGEVGASLGLCIQFSTPNSRVLVHHRGRLRANTSLPEGAELRYRLWRVARVAHTKDGKGLLVKVNGVTIISNLPLDDPPFVRWRVALRLWHTHRADVGQREERHDVRNFRAKLGAVKGPTRILPQLTLNGQQYVGANTFDYYPDAPISAVAPASGPLAGGTQLTLSGRRLQGGSDYRCRFSRRNPDGIGASTRPVRVTAAALHADGLVRCNSSDGAISGGADPFELLELSLNGQQYHAASGLNFSVHPAPSVVSLSPSAGPALGQTTVALTLGGALVSAGANHTCRFGAGVDASGPVVVPGTAVTGGAAPGGAGYAILCASPPVVRPTDPLYGPRPLYGDALPRVPLEYSLNGQQYTVSGVQFAYLADASTISAVSPTTGPLAGGTRVRILGPQLWGDPSRVPDRVCKFGDARVAANLTATVDELECVAPSAPRGSAGFFSMVESDRPLRIAINGQQFGGAIDGVFRQYAEIVISSIVPSSGPATGGGTRVTVHGAGLDGLKLGSHPKCAWRASASSGGGGGGEEEEEEAEAEAAMR